MSVMQTKAIPETPRAKRDVPRRPEAIITKVMKITKNGIITTSCIAIPTENMTRIQKGVSAIRDTPETAAPNAVRII